MEWKHENFPELLPDEYSLKPSLVEWKQRVPADAALPLPALKPSLVEWKLRKPGHLERNRRGLETFLVGMLIKLVTGCSVMFCEVYILVCVRFCVR